MKNRSEITDKGLVYHKNGNKSYTVYASELCSFTEIRIPAEYKGLPVTEIGKLAFYSCPDLVSVTIPDTVTAIGSGAFAKCESLTCVNIPGSVKTIKKDAFYECESLKTAALGEGVEEIGDGAFERCENLESIILPDSVVSIGKRAFEGCGSMSSITIGKGVKKIGEDALLSCFALRAILYKGDENQWKKLMRGGKDIMISYGTYIAYEFNGSIVRNDMVIEGNEVKAYIGNGESAVVPDGVTSVALNEFRCCLNLKYITIPESVTSLAGSFYFLDRLKAVIYSGSEEKWAELSAQSEGLKFTPALFKGGKAKEQNGMIIENGVLITCSEDVETVFIPEGVTEIGKGAFKYCKNLMKVFIPAGVKSIGPGAFYECPELTEVTIPGGTASIGDLAFAECSKLTYITLPDSVVSLGSHIFDGTYDLKAVCFAGTYQQWDTVHNTTENSDADYAVVCGYDGKTARKKDMIIDNGVLVTCSADIVNAVIPEEVTKIGCAAFKNCNQLTHITVPDTVTEIGKEAFSGCSELKSVVLSNSIDSIADEAFRGTAIERIAVPDRVKTIGALAFYSDSLTSVALPAGLTSIGKRAFTAFEQKLTVYFAGTRKQWKKITKPHGNAIFDAYPNAKIKIVYNAGKEMIK